jgi:MtfA peptidase
LALKPCGASNQVGRGLWRGSTFGGSLHAMFSLYANWRRKRILNKTKLDSALWQRAVSAASFVRGLSEAELTRLNENVRVFLYDKEFSTTHDLELTEEMCVRIALQACLMTLNLDAGSYDGWRGIIIYPDEFVPNHQYVDEAGVVHTDRRPMTGMARSDGPVILSWADTQSSFIEDGANVVIHEFAHKLDMQNGDANGFPPLQKGMNSHAWQKSFAAAYSDFCKRVDAGEDTAIDPYASENPGEFFAVLSEVFFEMPRIIVEEYPAVYEQMKLFYRQDTLARLNGI